MDNTTAVGTSKRIIKESEDGDSPDVKRTKIECTLSLYSPHPALADQGKHEVEVCVEGYEGSMSWNACLKNPGHANFILASEFSLTHLPAQYRDTDILKFIKLWVELTVKLSICATSQDRTVADPFYKYRGMPLIRSGTGKVTDVQIIEDDKFPCPCSQCISSKDPCTKWAAIWVMTALHVVFDDIEVEKTSAIFHYDNEDLTTKKNMTTLYGCRVVDSNRHGDWCKFECATHDLEFATQINNALTPLMGLAEMIQERYRDDVNINMAIIASHPHGCAKYVTVGEWREMETFENKKENLAWTTYTYSTGTCKGSSGAPVWILGPDRSNLYAYYSHVHSEGGDHTKGEPNKSGAGDVSKKWDWGEDA
ncbi:unnamed protein product [Lymnaea stagnalis]|uniref:Uncharacterized protein n=1 Tax=Lymnaea stagnalis TaxID=6523 RepID=A0AAV2H8D8_LYMST